MTQRNHLHLVFAATLSIAAIATAQNPTDPPASQHAILTVTGKGVQIYACQQTVTGPHWVFRVPEATLTDSSGNPVGTHSAGPIWKSNDGSIVKGELLQRAHPPNSHPSPGFSSKPSVLQAQA